MANHTNIPRSLKKFHDDGACIVRHERDRKKHCHYDKNGYDETRTAARMIHYNAKGSPKPRGFAPADISDLKGSRKRRTDKNGKVHYRTTTPEQQKDPSKPNEKIWDVDGSARAGIPNFKPKARGAHYPYRHQWHHLIPSAALEQGLYHDEYRRKPILCLVVGKYNINHGKNIVLLPEEAQVGQIVKWPIHPNNHPKYNAYTKEKLKGARDKLAGALKRNDGDVHDMNEKTAARSAADVRRLSQDLYDQLEEWGRKGGAGVEINRIAEKPEPPPPGSGRGRGRFNK